MDPSGIAFRRHVGIYFQKSQLKEYGGVLGHPTGEIVTT